jgi:hypothetical protein
MEASETWEEKRRRKNRNTSTSITNGTLNAFLFVACISTDESVNKRRRYIH